MPDKPFTTGARRRYESHPAITFVITSNPEEVQKKHNNPLDVFSDVLEGSRGSEIGDEKPGGNIKLDESLAPIPRRSDVSASVFQILVVIVTKPIEDMKQH